MIHIRPRQLYGDSPRQQPPGAALSLVTIQKEKTIFVSPREIPKVDI